MTEEGGGKISIVLGKELDKAAAELLTRALGQFADELGGLAGDGIGAMRDRVAIWRRDNLRRCLARSAQRFAEDGLSAGSARVLPMSEAVPLLSGMSEVDDSTLQDLWAGLLASAMNPQSAWSVGRSFIVALNSMDSGDAALLSLVISQSAAIRELRSFAAIELGAVQRGPKSGEGSPLSAAYDRIEAEKARLWTPLSERPEVLRSREQFEAARHNLIRLGILEPLGSEDTELSTPRFITVRDEHRGTTHSVAVPESGGSRFSTKVKNPFQNILTPQGAIQLKLTIWGRRFVEACKVAPSESAAEE